MKKFLNDYSDDEFETIVRNSNSIADICRSLKYAICNTAYKTIKFRIKRQNLDISHIKLGLSNRRGTNSPNRISIVKHLTYGSKVGNKMIKFGCLREDLLKNICYKCGMLPVWNNEPISLQVDHINGDRYDNQLNNLRLLCPNCHSQTKTFSGRNKKVTAL